MGRQFDQITFWIYKVGVHNVLEEKKNSGKSFAFTTF